MYVQVIQYLCKADTNPFKTSKMFHSNSSKISALHFKMSLAWDFLFWISQFRASLTTCHQIYKLYPSFNDNVFCFDTIFYSKSTQVHSVFYSQYPGHLNTHVIIVNVYRSIGISKQSLSTNVPVCIHSTKVLSDTLCISAGYFEHG